MIVILLRELLLNEYLQRDIYETYSYYLFGLAAPTVQIHLKSHQQEEQLHIDLLKRYLMGLGEPPLSNRLPIPKLPLRLQDLLRYNLDLEAKAVKRYEECIHTLKPHAAYSSLREDLENILAQEQSHSNDLTKHMNQYSKMYDVSQI